MKFFVGLPEPSMAQHFEHAFISANRLRRRKGNFSVEHWIMDSGAYSEISRHGGYRSSVREYAALIRRWRWCGNLLAAVAQDWMCEQDVLEKTGLIIAEHQRMTIDRYDQLRAEDTEGVYVMPVLQGWTAGEYADHVRAYGKRLKHGAWVGVGSVCKRNTNPLRVLRVLYAIKDLRPDLRLHGFGVKLTALQFQPLRELLHTCDSMAWSWSARKQGRDQNDWREAVDWLERLQSGAA